MLLAKKNKQKFYNLLIFQLIIGSNFHSNRLIETYQEFYLLINFVINISILCAILEVFNIKKSIFGNRNFDLKYFFFNLILGF